MPSSGIRVEVADFFPAVPQSLLMCILGAALPPQHTQCVRRTASLAPPAYARYKRGLKNICYTHSGERLHDDKMRCWFGLTHLFVDNSRPTC